MKAHTTNVRLRPSLYVMGVFALGSACGNPSVTPNVVHQPELARTQQIARPAPPPTLHEQAVELYSTCSEARQLARALEQERRPRTEQVVNLERGCRQKQSAWQQTDVFAEKHFASALALLSDADPIVRALALDVFGVQGEQGTTHWTERRESLWPVLVTQSKSARVQSNELLKVAALLARIPATTPAAKEELVSLVVAHPNFAFRTALTKELVRLAQASKTSDEVATILEKFLRTLPAEEASSLTNELVSKLPQEGQDQVCSKLGEALDLKGAVLLAAGTCKATLWKSTEQFEKSCAVAAPEALPWCGELAPLLCAHVGAKERAFPVLVRGAKASPSVETFTNLVRCDQERGKRVVSAYVKNPNSAVAEAANEVLRSRNGAIHF
jgi:hypothetical protein